MTYLQELAISTSYDLNKKFKFWLRINDRGKILENELYRTTTLS